MKGLGIHPKKFADYAADAAYEQVGWWERAISPPYDAFLPMQDTGHAENATWEPVYRRIDSARRAT